MAVEHCETWDRGRFTSYLVTCSMSQFGAFMLWKGEGLEVSGRLPLRTGREQGQAPCPGRSGPAADPFLPCSWQSVYQSYGSPSQYGMASSYGSAAPQHQGPLNQVMPMPIPAARPGRGMVGGEEEPGDPWRSGGWLW